MNVEKEFGTEFLDHLYKYWDENLNKNHYNYYIRYSKKMYPNRDFEDWLWSNGFSVRRLYNVKYLRYYGDEKQLTLFLLRYR